MRLLTAGPLALVWAAALPAPAGGAADSALAALYRLDRLAERRAAAATGTVSSYDRSGGNDDGFSGKYSYVRREGDGLVLAELEGPGAIYRIHSPTPTDDIVEFYHDGEEQPRLRLPFSDLFSGAVAPFVKPLAGCGVGGCFSYVPIVYDRSLKIVLRAPKFQFYQLNWARFAQPAAAATAEELQRAARLLEGAGSDISQWVAPPGARVETARAALALAPGQSRVAFETRRAGRLVGLRVSPAAEVARKDRSLVLRMFWDGDSTPAVAVPLGDLFGYAWGQPAARGLIAGTAAGVNYLYLPMPFDRSARVEVANEGPAPARLDVEVLHTAVGRAANEGRFYAVWRRENPTIAGQPFTFLDIRGQGHIVGAILQAQGLEAGDTEFFEGDDQAWIDGRLTHIGTGTEDFFNGGWYDVAGRWEERLSLPLSGSLGYMKALGRTGGYRFLLSDAYAFERSIRFVVEHGPTGNQHPADYAAVTLFYCLSRPEGLPALPPVEARAVRDPARIVFVPGRGQPVHAFSMHKATIGRRSEQLPEGRVRYFVLEGEGDDLLGPHFVAFVCDLPAAGRYRIFLEGWKGPEQSIVQVFRSERPAGPALDFHAPQRRRSGQLEAAVLDMQEGSNTLFLKLVGNSHPGARKRMDLDRIIFERVD